MTSQTVEYGGVPAVPRRRWRMEWQVTTNEYHIASASCPIGHEAKTQPSHHNHPSSSTPLTAPVSVPPYSSPNAKTVVKVTLEAQRLEPANLDLFNKKNQQMKKSLVPANRTKLATCQTKGGLHPCRPSSPRQQDG